MKVERWCLALAAVVALSLACTKTNTVERNLGPDQEPANNAPNNEQVGEIGDQCDSEAATGCGVASRCVLGFCRFGCTNDAECPRGSICIGTEPPFGCALEQELNCEGAADCDLGLTCGLDNKCRHPCAEDDDCTRNEHVCIAGACVSQNEGDFDKWDFPCTRGNICCVLDENQVEALPDSAGGNCVDPPDFGFRAEGGDNEENHLIVCNVTGPGWQIVDTCRNGETCSDAHFDYCVENHPPPPDAPRGQRADFLNCVATGPDNLPTCR